MSSLISDITIPPPLAKLILDTNVGEPWIEAIVDFERRLNTSRERSRVKAARDLVEVAEGLRIVVRPALYQTYCVQCTFQGCYQTPSFLHGSISAHPGKCYYQYAGYTNCRPPQVPAPVRIFAATGCTGCHRIAEGLRWRCTNVLRDWV